jgi:DNA polymerase-3 subunit delta
MIVKSYIAEKNNDIFNNNLLLFYGENLGLKQDFVKKINNFFKKNNIVNKNQDEILNNENVFFSNLFNISLFEKRRIFLITQCNDKILKILDQIDEKLEDQKIFLFADLLDKKSKLRGLFEKSEKKGCIPCYLDNEVTLRNIITTKLKGFTGLSLENLNLIIESCNAERSKLNNELDKIVSYFDEKKIRTDELEKLLNIKSIENFDYIKNSVICGNKLKTNKLLSDTILEPEKNIFYLSTINRHLNQLSQIVGQAKSKNYEKAINDMKPPIFWKEKPFYLDQVQKWNLRKIGTAFKKTYEAEILIKSNSLIDKNILLKKLLIDLCDLART